MVIILLIKHQISHMSKEDFTSLRRFVINPIAVDSNSIYKHIQIQRKC